VPFFWFVFLGKQENEQPKEWIPAFAGMTTNKVAFPRSIEIFPPRRIR
jgi:hypothetical protein